MIKTLADIEVSGKVIVLRADLNVPLSAKNPENQLKITEFTRLSASIPTILELLDRGAKQIHILTHLGRPKGERKHELSTKILQKPLEKHLNQPVEHRFDLTAGENRLQLHENTRFWPGEKQNSSEFVQKLRDLGAEVFVLDAFGTAHRAHGSVIGLAEYVPTAAGRLLEAEINTLTPFRAKNNEKITQNKQKGLTLVVGGAKMDTKIGILKHFAQFAGNILIGGAMANTFLAAEGFDVGESLYQKDLLETAREVLLLAEKHKTGVHLPVDVICADDLAAKSGLDVPIEDVMGKMKILDLGPHTIASFKEVLAHSETVLWNGPMGMFEKPGFAVATREITQKISEIDAKTIVGGGDSLAAIKKFEIPSQKFTHVSTGGGAMLEFLEGKALPGIEIIQTF